MEELGRKTRHPPRLVVGARGAGAPVVRPRVDKCVMSRVVVALSALGTLSMANLVLCRTRMSKSRILLGRVGQMMLFLLAILFANIV